jgi:hypothetical protein
VLVKLVTQGVFWANKKCCLILGRQRTHVLRDFGFASQTSAEAFTTTKYMQGDFFTR